MSISDESIVEIGEIILTLKVIYALFDAIAKREKRYP
jgi:hypothetical protein